MHLFNSNFSNALEKGDFWLIRGHGPSSNKSAYQRPKGEKIQSERAESEDLGHQLAHRGAISSPAGVSVPGARKGQGAR